MSKGVARDWPADDDLIALVEREGSVNAAAEALGCTNKVLRDQLLRRKILDRAKAVTARQATPIPDSDGGVSELEILRAEIAELRANARRERKTDVQSERIIRAVEQALKDVPTPARAMPAKPAAKASGVAHHRQLLILSDFHGGEVVDREVVNGLNSYNWQIMLDRVDEVIAAVTSHGKHAPPLTGLDVLFVGDMNSGNNHDELATTNEFPLAEQSVRMGVVQGQIIERLAPHFSEVRVGGVEGNHPRFSTKPAAKNPHDNGDWISNVFAKQYLAPHGVSYQIGRGSLLWEIAGRTVYVFHGDGIMSAMPGVPWGGIMRRVNQLQATMPQRIDHFVLGHFHSANVVQGGRIVANASLKGVDEYCLKKFGGGDPPTQLLVTFDEHAERLTDVRYITPKAGL